MILQIDKMLNEILGSKNLCRIDANNQTNTVNE